MNRAQLDQGLAALQAAAEHGNPRARQAELFAKSQEGSITPEEQDELLKSLGGGDSLAAEITAPLQNNDELQKSVEVSDYLRENHEATITALERVADTIAKSEASDQNFRVALAQSVLSLGEMVKSLHGQVEQLSGQPAHAPKSQGVRAPAQAMTKSFANTPEQPTHGGLAPHQIDETFTSMLEKGMTEVAGQKVDVAATMYETDRNISKSMLDAVVDFHKSNSAA